MQEREGGRVGDAYSPAAWEGPGVEQAGASAEAILGERAELEHVQEQEQEDEAGRFEGLFLNESPYSQHLYRDVMRKAGDVLIREFAAKKQPYSGETPQRLRELLEGSEIGPREPAEDWKALFDEIGADVLRHSAIVTHPACAAHLHCPPLLATLAAEAWISAMNQSMDSWDQSMSGTMLEEAVVAWLRELFRLPAGADGVFTSGGTQSNFMGLLLARNHFASSRWGWNVQHKGLPLAAGRMRILCSEAAHFTVKQSAALLGLGEHAVVTVPCDERRRMSPDALLGRLAQMKAADLIPIAIVATAGTTDYGSIDPLPEIAVIAEEHGLWFHVDAAYGGALALSDLHAGRLEGLERADSVTVDFHKGFYQPVSCGAFLVREGERLQTIRLHADYLNPEEDEEEGVPNLVVKSVQTTRRFDALKLYVSLRYYGRRTFGDMVDHTIRTAAGTARLIEREAKLALMAEPELGTVVFRYIPDGEDGELADAVNAGIRARLLEEGSCILARTRVNGRLCLKLTILNPLTTLAHTARMLELVVFAGERLESDSAGEAQGARAQLADHGGGHAKVLT
ncbi:pyridoxal phosphate-dependent decarboxylase family protein [Paenibacillus aurantiacus]|uniref:Pyridoxal phosphate-dependent decarboxylase family protein n=1 Tax=Paenibacillus aurantiacus TaxID=1936118 RepID=A0ABV5KKL8_9BACL